MKPVLRTVVISTLTCLFCIAGWRLHSGSWPLFGQTARAAFAERSWRAGSVYRYRVSWQQESVARTSWAPGSGAPEKLEGSVGLEAILGFEPLAAEGDTLPVNVTLEAVRAASVKVLGQDLLADPATRKSLLAPRTLRAEMSRHGELLRLKLPKDTPELYAQLVEGVVLQLQDTRGQAARSEERAPDGVFRVRYEPATGGRSARRVRSLALSIPGLESPCDGECRISLEGGASLTFDDRGDLSQIDDLEKAQAGSPGAPPLYTSKLRFQAELASVTPAAPKALAASSWGVKIPGEPWQSDQTERALLEQRAAGISIDDVISGVELIGSFGPERIPGGWLARATAFLALHPELLGELSVRFEKPGATHPAKVAILDLLAATGTPEAQREMRNLLSRAAANEDPKERLALLQRLMLIEKPDTETLEFLRDRFETSRAGGDVDMELAAAHALGSVAHRVGSETEREEAQAATGALEQALAEAKQPAERAGLLRALGNAGASETIPAVVRHASDADEHVRAATAAALRKTSSAEAQTTLVSLAADRQESVQVVALDSLAGQPLTEDVIGKLAGLLESGTLSGRAESEIVTLLARQESLTAGMRAALSAVLERTSDNRLRARIRMLLGGTGASTP